MIRNVVKIDQTECCPVATLSCGHTLRLREGRSATRVRCDECAPKPVEHGAMIVAHTRKAMLSIVVECERQGLSIAEMIFRMRTARIEVPDPVDAGGRRGPRRIER